jgi:TrmH family RNA methyltransferase
MRPRSHPAQGDPSSIEIPDAIRIVLVDTAHPGNIGASARAMKTMGLKRLVLVAPEKFPSVEVTARAAGADDILARAQVCRNLSDAIKDCGYILGTSARVRNIPWPLINPEQAAREVISQARAGTETAVLFGTERTGLSNQDLETCQAVIEIPAEPGFRSLNVAAAVQVICYELRKAAVGLTPPVPEKSNRHPAAGAGQMRLFYEDLEQFLREIDFYNPRKPRLLMRRLKRMFNRMQPDMSEYNVLRGIIAAARNWGTGRKKNLD